MSCEISAWWFLKFWFLHTGFYCIAFIRVASCKLEQIGKPTIFSENPKRKYRKEKIGNMVSDQKQNFSKFLVNF